MEIDDSEVVQTARKAKELLDRLEEYKPLAKVEELTEQNYNQIDNVLNNGAEKKEQELADLQGKAQQAAQAQMSSLADAKESISKAGESDNETDRSADGKKTEHDSEKVKEDGTQDSSEPDSQNIYKKIDIRL